MRKEHLMFIGWSVLVAICGYLCCANFVILMDINYDLEASWSKVVFALFSSICFSALAYSNCSVSTLKALRKDAVIFYRTDGNDERFLWLRDKLTEIINRRYC